MANPMVQALGMGRSNTPSPNNPVQMLLEFKKFASGMTPQKARQEVERMLTSGQMSQSQFEQLQQQAKSFMSFLR